MSEKGAMFDEFVQGGLLDDAIVTIREARFSQWDYQGKIAAPVLALKVVNVDAEGNAHEDYLSCGELRHFVPSADGKRAIPVGAQQKLNINTNAIMFIVSVINADTRGELAAKLRSTDDISILDGLQYHLVRKAQPKRASIATPDKQDEQRTKTYTACEKIIAYPWEAKQVTAAAPAGASAAVAPAQTTAAPAAAAPAAANGHEDLAVGTLVGIIAGSGGSIKVGQIAGKVFTDDGMKAQPAPVRNAVIGLIVRPDFLGAAGRPWTYDQAAGTVSLG